MPSALRNQVIREEAKQPARASALGADKSFAAADTNGDGSLSFEEFMAFS